MCPIRTFLLVYIRQSAFCPRSLAVALFPRSSRPVPGIDVSQGHHVILMRCLYSAGDQLPSQSIGPQASPTASDFYVSSSRWHVLGLVDFCRSVNAVV